MSDNIVIPTLEQLALLKIAKKLWNILNLQHANYFYYCKTDRHDISESLQEIFSIRFPNLLKDKLVDAMMNLKLGCGEAYDWLLFYRGIIELSEETQKCEDLKLKCDSVLFSEKRQYEPMQFIDLSGHFDDLSWAKLFVADEKQPLKSRFYLACLYCFEEEIHTIWNAGKSNNQSLCEDDFGAIFNTGVNLVRMWIFHLEHGIQNNFYVDGFNEAFQGNLEYAAKFFWRHCSMNERARVLSELDFFYVACAAGNDRVGFVCFIYGLLSVELKNRLISFNSFLIDGIKIWVCLLCSSNYKSILNDIQTCSRPLHINFYKFLLEDIAFLIRDYSILHYKLVFIAIWNSLSHNEQNEILRCSKMFISLCCPNGFDLFKEIISPLPRTMKNNELSNYSRFLSILEASWFFDQDDYDGFLGCLLFFFLEYESTTKKLTLRTDAANLYNRLMHSEQIEESIKYLNPSQVQTFHVIMEHFRETLPVIDELINRMNCADITHDILPRKILPLLSVKDKI